MLPLFEIRNFESKLSLLIELIEFELVELFHYSKAGANEEEIKLFVVLL